MNRRPVWLLALPGVAIATVPLVAGLLRGPTLDASVFAVIAEEMRGGSVPYRDYFDHKPPIIYLTEWATGVAFPFVDAWTRAWAITLVASLATLVLLATRLGHARPLGTVLVVAFLGPLFGAQYFAQGGGQTESLAVLPATAGFLLVMGERRPTIRGSIAAGALIGIAGATSFQVAPLMLGVLVCLLLDGGGVRAAVAYVGGGLAVALALLAWLFAAGALPAALEQLIAYNRAYLTGQSFFHPIPLLNLSVALLILAPVVGAVTVRLTDLVVRRDGNPAVVGSAVTMIVWAMLVVAQGQFIGHYAIVLAAPLAILGLPVFDRFGAWFADPRSRLLAVTAALLTVSFPLLAVWSTEHGAERRPPIDAASAVLQRLTPTGGRVFVWGNEPYVYLLTGREPAGRYVYLFPLTKPSFTTDEMVSDVLNDWERDPPAAIVDASIHRLAVSSHPLLGEWIFAEDVVPDRLDPLRSFVRAQYREAAVVDEWTIYVPN